MAGFLDSKERVIDMVLTGVGKNLLMRGDLRFVYWVPFDDEVDYDLNTEDPLIREANSGYRVHNAASEDRTNVNRPLFTIPSGQKNIPTLALDSGSVEIVVNQKKIAEAYAQQGSQTLPVHLGVLRYGPSEVPVAPRYTPKSYPDGFPLEGFLITVYHSSSDGFVEVLPTWDSSGSTVYSNDLKVEAETNK